MTDRAVVLLSGGLDSSTAAYLAGQDHDLICLSVDYGQRHRRELRSAGEIAERLKARHRVLDLSSLNLGGSALTDAEREIPEGHYTAETMRQTVVPNRNAILLSLAFGVAVAEGARLVVAAPHAGDHAIYPDCRPEFISAFRAMEFYAVEGMTEHPIGLWAPFVSSTKADIVAAGVVLGVPYELTWSCYKGGEIHCGRCGTCVERAEAFSLAGAKDPTSYADPDYWRTVKRD